MKRITRRAALQLFASAPVAAAMAWTPAEAEQAHHDAQQARTAAAKSATAFKPKFFTAHEYATVGILVDLIIPRDDRSGSATDAGVPEFMDFMMIDQPAPPPGSPEGLRYGCLVHGAGLRCNAGRAETDPEVHRLRTVDRRHEAERVGRGASGDANADADARRARDPHLDAAARQVAACAAPASA